MSLPKFAPQTKEEEQRGPQVEEGRYYRGQVIAVDFFRDKEGKAVGNRPGKQRPDGSIGNPHGSMRIHVDVKLDEEYGYDDPVAVISMPCPWNNRDKEAWPWVGDAESGKPNHFTNEQIGRFIRHIRTGDQMPNAIAIVAKRFGYTAFLISEGIPVLDDKGKPVLDEKGQPLVTGKGLPVPQDLDFAGLMMGKRVMVGRVKIEGRQGASWDIQPHAASQSIEKPLHLWISELFGVLNESKMGNGEPFTPPTVLAAMARREMWESLAGKTNMAGLGDDVLKAITDTLVASCESRLITVPSRYVTKEKGETEGL